ncbi:MAG: DUF5615 family PIN-like protein [Deltaproteobacteria bacterium]|nr:DUF5615 family PIN-like protein [Deltaproteobacteria bacterium]MBW2253078.1 DUF5615 family PIN-like protein [Deltaproteobacteria bacterium]
MFKLDENLPTAAAVRLREAGFDTATVLSQQLGGAPDARVAEVCASEGRVLVTLDLDFADIRAFPPGSSPGIVVLRAPRQDLASVLALVEQLLEALESHSVDGSLWIVEPGQIRVREARPT